MIAIGFLRRLLHRGPDDHPDVTVAAATVSGIAPETRPPARIRPAALPSCPYCGIPLDAPPVGAGRCTRCRRRMVVRHLARRPVYLTEAAVEVFDDARRREADERRWAAERERWLRRAAGVGAAPDRVRRLERAPASAEAVCAARDLYVTAADREVRAARRTKDWTRVSLVRREEAATLFRDAGSPVPPPDGVIRQHQEAAAAALRAMEGARHADLVGASCCPACRADDGRTFAIAAELRAPRLPHAGCPRGLCACDWWIATEEPTKPRRRTRASVRATASATPAVPCGTDTASAARIVPAGQAVAASLTRSDASPVGPAASAAPRDAATA